MTIEIYDDKPERLKCKIAQCYKIQVKKEQRLMIPAKDDYIFINIIFKRDTHTSLSDLLTHIARTYWNDRMGYKYEELEGDIIADRWKALHKNKKGKQRDVAKIIQ